MAVPVARPIDRASLLKHLALHRILSRLRETDLERLLDRAKPRHLAARAKLFEAGSGGNAIYIVLAGWIKLSRPGPNGRDLLLELAGAGNMFGELAVIGQLPRGADATALVAADLLAIDGGALIETLRANPEALLEVTRMLGERLARANAQLEDTMFLPAETRLARALLGLAALETRPSSATPQIDLGLSQRELGELTGLSREGTNRQLALWRDAGLVALNGRVLTLANSVALAEIAGCGAPKS
jgi:CRP-like cAMP-binding protein